MSDTESHSPRVLDARSVKANTLMRAAQILGGIDRLSAYLSVSQPDLISWMAGLGEPPLASFMLAVDVVLEDSETYGVGANHRARRLLPENGSTER